MNITPIEWTTFSANPLKYRTAAGTVVWGCVHASPGCQHCYSEALARRYGRGGPFNVQTMAGLTPFLDDAELHKMRTAKTIGGKAVSGSRCFIGDMTDIFGEWVPDDLLNQLFSQTLEIRTDVTWQILTKRAKRMHDYLSWRWGDGRIPSRHIHIGVSAEDQPRANERIAWLVRTPAAVRFVSVEPLLSQVSFRWGCWYDHRPHPRQKEHLPPVERDGRIIAGSVDHLDGLRMLDWVIVGGESGRHARPFDVEWARSIVAQCQAAGVPVFVKQLGSNAHIPDEWNGKYTTDITLRDRKGGDPSEWPDDLRVRQFPQTAIATLS